MSVFDLTIHGATLARELVLAPEEAKEALALAGFQDPERAMRNLEDLADPRAFGQLPNAFFREIVDAANPDLALNNFERMVRAAMGRAAFLRQLEDRPGLCRLLLRILGGSPFMADILVRDPESFYWLTDRPERIAESNDHNSLVATFDQAIGAVESKDHKLNAIRRAARRELLRIGVGDLAGDRPIQYVAADLSVLADVCLQTLIGILMPDLEARYGTPKNGNGQLVGFSVIGLGKLGGMELNFSSDIDLMFVYDAEGNTDGGVDGNVVSNQEFFTRLCEQIVRGATEVTEEGFLYRIDMRLRPDGAAGALVMPLAGYEGYYMRRGELWERQMLIKARWCAGSEGLGQRFLEMVQPFVYPRYFEASPAAEIHRIKGRIEDRIGRKGQGETHLKLRSGGIRDVEFIVQCLQLLVGRMHKNARSDNTLEAIRQLQRVSALSEEESDSLKAAYVFYRRLEHRLQMMHNRSDYALPEREEDQRMIARTLGFESIAEYRHILDRHLKAVQAVYANVFGDEQEHEGRSVGVLVHMEPGDPEAVKLLEEIGFDRPEEAHRNLIYMAFGHVPRIRGTHARQSFTGLAPALMRALQDSADPDQGLSNLERVVSAYGAGDTLFRILTTNEGFRDLMLSLCVGSQFLVNVMVRNPGLLDWLIRPDVLHQNPSAEALQEQLHALVDRHGDTDALVGALNGLKNRELLRIGTRDLVGLTETFETFEALTVLADAFVQVAYGVMYAQLVKRWGVPRSRNGEPVGFVVLGLGKMGGMELSFGSDLDIVFVYGEDGVTDGEKPQGNLQFFIELAQKMTAMLEQNTSFGKLYQVDARLRPEGASAILALSHEAYDRYLETRASTWERMALSRSRVVAGDMALGKKLLDRFESFVVGTGFSDAEVTTMCNIRKQMERKDGGRSSRSLSIKTGPGGIVDIEFIAQILQLRFAKNHSELRQVNTIETLKRLAAGTFLGTEDFEVLTQSFHFLRTVEKVIRRQDEQARTRLPAEERALTALARAAGYETAADFAAVLKDKMEKTRAIFERVIKETEDRR